jgi:protein ImuB
MDRLACVNISAPNVEAVYQELSDFSPKVEISDEPGIYWLDASGLQHIYPTLTHWVRAILTRLPQAVIAVGFSKFFTYAIAKRKLAPTLVFNDPTHEQHVALSTPLQQLLNHDVCMALEQLEIRTLAQLLQLPATGLQERFGKAILHLHQLARGDLKLGLLPTVTDKPLQALLTLEFPETDLLRLCFLLKTHLHPLLQQLSERYHVLAALQLTLHFSDKTQQAFAIKPAHPSLDLNLIVDLIRLRLDNIVIETPITEITLLLQSTPLSSGQMPLFAATRRDVYAGMRALARVRAELGHQAVGRFNLREAHLPEEQFMFATHAFDKAEDLNAKAFLPATYARVRRFFQQPQAFYANPIWLSGPHRIKHRWWNKGVCRDYYYARSQQGAWLWIYYCHQKKMWFLQGEVD